MDRAFIDESLPVPTFPPAAHDLQRLADAGFKSIVNLRQAGEQGEKLEWFARERARVSGRTIHNHQLRHHARTLMFEDEAVTHV